MNGNYVWQDHYGRVQWKYYFLGLCFIINQRSYDPSTKQGCVITDQENTILSVGYNSPPRKCNEDEVSLERPNKYDWMVHAEEAAIINASRSGVGLKDSIFYVTGKPCVRCLRGIINCGAKKLIYGPLNTVEKCDNNFQKMIDSYKGTLEIECVDSFINIIDSLEQSIEYCRQKCNI